MSSADVLRRCEVRQDEVRSALVWGLRLPPCSAVETVREDERRKAEIEQSRARLRSEALRARRRPWLCGCCSRMESAGQTPPHIKIGNQKFYLKTTALKWFQSRCQVRALRPSILRICSGVKAFSRLHSSFFGPRVMTEAIEASR
jgi:hypothetical protein